MDKFVIINTTNGRAIFNLKYLESIEDVTKLDGDTKTIVTLSSGKVIQSITKTSTILKKLAAE